MRPLATIKPIIYMQAKYVRYLEIIGVGYKATIEETILNLQLGFSHAIQLQVPANVRVFCLKPTLICCTGTNLQDVTQFAAIIKNCKPPEVYKGKGIRYRNEKHLQKQGKKK